MSGIKRVHYPNLNSVRFIAASMVLIHHCEQIKSIFKYPNIFDNHTFVPLAGKLGVDLFFVLSGFLISSLLIIEKEYSGTIKVKNFIIRRLYRIWPVYFLIVIVGFFLLPHVSIFQVGRPFINIYPNFWASLTMYILFLPHVQIMIIGPIIGAAQAWSIGIEEEFYLVWPFLVKKFDTKKLLKIIFIFVAIYLAVTLFLRYEASIVINRKDNNAPGIQVLYQLFANSFKFDCLLIGCYFAYLNKKITDYHFLLSKWFQLSVYLTEIILAYNGSDFRGFYWEIHAVLYGFILMNLIRAKTSLINLEIKPLNYLGKISYGMYMYHIIVIVAVFRLLQNMQLMVLFYPVVFASVIMVSVLSYEVFERRFLKKKLSFTTIFTN